LISALNPAQDMQKGRFIEIPALHQTALFKKAAILEVISPSGHAASSTEAVLGR
jgi:hypothetical protein